MTRSISSGTRWTNDFASMPPRLWPMRMTLRPVWR